MNGTVIQFEQHRLAEFLRLPCLLQDIVMDVAEEWPTSHMTIGCIYRTHEEDARLRGSGVHPAMRAVDLPGRVLSDNPDLAWTRLSEIALAVNARWIYDHTRPDKVVCYAAPHGTGPHIHCQVHANTRRVDLHA